VAESGKGRWQKWQALWQAGDRKWQALWQIGGRKWQGRWQKVADRWKCTCGSIFSSNSGLLHHIKSEKKASRVFLARLFAKRKPRGMRKKANPRLKIQ